MLSYSHGTITIFLIVLIHSTINRFIRILVVPIILVGYILLRRFPKLFYVQNYVIVCILLFKINVLLITLCTLLCTSMVALIDSNCADNRYTVEVLHQVRVNKLCI